MAGNKKASELGEACSELAVTVAGDKGEACSELDVTVAGDKEAIGRMASSELDVTELGKACSELGVTVSGDKGATKDSGKACSELGVTTASDEGASSGLGKACSELGVTISGDKGATKDSGKACSELGVTTASDEGASSGLGVSLTTKVKSLLNLQAERDKIFTKYNEEHSELRQKYEKLYEPLYQKRYEIVSDLPNFWLVVLQSDDVIAKEISERDKKALKYLKDIRCIQLDMEHGYQLDFIFDQNPYFLNTELTKRFQFANVEIETLTPCLLKSTGTIINWRRGQSLIEKRLKRKSRSGDQGIKIEKCASFFNFFNSIDAKAEDDIIQKHYTIGNNIRKNIIPFAALWFEAEKFPQGIDEE